jgi:DNA polymerase-1
MQNVPFALKEADLNLKALFIPDSDEFEFVDLDISNAEMRVLCAYSQDEALIEAFKQGKDIHCLTAAGISDYTYDEILANKEDKTTDHYLKRQVAKKVNFGTIYMMGAETLKKNLWKDMRIDITVEEAEDYLERFFQTYPGVRNYINMTQNFASRFKFTYTFTGHRRRFPIAVYSNDQINRVARQAVNSRIQTTSAVMVNKNMWDLDPAVESLGGRLLLTVHDSVGLQRPKGVPGFKQILDEIILENTAANFPWMPVPWKYDAGYGPSYGEAHNAI